ncbi:MAG: PIN domain-containing protein [Verrucomicrobiales bacterium]
MSAERFFVDTNVLVYAFDRTSPTKRTIAGKLLKTKGWQISWQVIQEFAHVARHRFAEPFKPTDLADYLDLVLWPRCTVLPSADVYRQALLLHEVSQYRFYDSLIVAGALVSDAEVLYSEDLQDGREFGSLRIVNPFRAD